MGVGVAAQPLAERAGDVGCPLVQHGGAVLEAGGVLIGTGDDLAVRCREY
ncbi:hypothetical protein [Streptomyces sp. NPDC001401]